MYHRWSFFEYTTARKVPRSETRCQVLTTRGGKSLDIQKTGNEATVLVHTMHCIKIISDTWKV